MRPPLLPRPLIGRRWALDVKVALLGILSTLLFLQETHNNGQLKNYKHWDFPIIRRAPFTVPGTISIKIDVRKEGFEMYISNWRVLYDHRMDKTFAQTVTFLGDLFVRECFLNRYSGLKKSFANEINVQSESSVSKEESSSENKAEDECYDDEENDSEELDSNEDDE